MTHTDELVLRTVVFQFDGRVVEIFARDPHAGVIRYHVALMKEPRVAGPNRKGRSEVFIESHVYGIDADEMEQFKPFLAKINEAIAGRPRSPASGR